MTPRQLKYNDRQHAYWLDGKRCKGVTTVAKMPDDRWHLELWGKRMVALGLALTPPLVQRVKAHFDEKDKLDEIAEEALVAAKAHEASGRGTAIHRETERVDLGLDFIDTPESQAIRQAWTAALASAGLEVVPEYVERIVVYPDQLVAGRFDRYCRRVSDGALVVVDVKTGENAIKYPHATTCQLALYANAPLLAGPLTRQGKYEIATTFEPMPDDLDRQEGYVVYLPAEGPGQVYRLDLVAGWDAVSRICFPTINWRNQKDLIEQVNVPGLAPPATTTERHTWICRRIRVIVDAGHEPALAGLWDTSKVPAPIHPHTTLTDEQVDLVVDWCAQVEAAVEAPFPDTDPLFAAFAQATAEATVAPRVPPAESPVDGARGELARHWVQQAKQLFDAYDLDEPTIRAVVAAAGMTGTETMTQHLYVRLASLVAEAHDVNGAVIFTYTDDGTLQISSAPDAEARMATVAGTRGEARDRAARLAKQMGRIAPRSLTKAAENPLLAALVAAGYGLDTPTDNT